jgi:hypothetical protein
MKIDLQIGTSKEQQEKERFNEWFDERWAQKIAQLWQPIETAPKDGTFILAWWNVETVEVPLQVLRYNPHFRSWEDPTGETFYPPDFWIEIPKSPKK